NPRGGRGPIGVASSWIPPLVRLLGSRTVPSRIRAGREGGGRLGTGRLLPDSRGVGPPGRESRFNARGRGRERRCGSGPRGRQCASARSLEVGRGLVKRGRCPLP